MVIMFVVGAAIGSFLCCQVRRLNHFEKTHKKLGSRSICLKCKKKLHWYENIPIISWIVLGGKCKKCKAKIGIAEVLSEIGMALAFLGIASKTDIMSASLSEWILFGLYLAVTIALGFLAIYDGIYGELPNFALVIAVCIGLAIAAYTLFPACSWDKIIATIFAVCILGGIYLVLYLISKGKWVGDGDWILGTVIGLSLGSPWLALVVLFLSNTIACFVMYPSVKNKKSKQIHFGPFLVIAFVIALTFSNFIEGMILY